MRLGRYIGPDKRFTGRQARLRTSIFDSQVVSTSFWNPVTGYWECRGYFKLVEFDLETVQRVGTYVGPDAGLKGKRAMLLVCGESAKAQFDDRGAQPAEERDMLGMPSMGYGLHPFKLADFELEANDHLGET